MDRRTVELTRLSRRWRGDPRANHHRVTNPETTRELTSLVRNLNQLLKSERERYNKYH